jgi:hypothetical protein
MTSFSDRLYSLLPVIYRLRDSEQGEPLRALLSIISEELDRVEADITGLYENWFIETSDEWVVPYIGDLLAVRGLNPIKATAFSQRAYVANTLYYRRRNGTAHVLETLAKDVTGWAAQAVEFFELLQTTQYLNHCRLFNTMPDLRDINRLDLLDTPFDSLPHTVDVRHINTGRGKHNIPNLGLFLWRLQNYRLTKVAARKASDDYKYHFSPIGNPAPLFNAPLGSGFPDEQDVSAPIRSLDFYFDLKNYADKFGSPSASEHPDNSRYYGPQRSLQIVKDDMPIPPNDVMCKNLSTWAQPPSGKVAVDIERGRITFPDDMLPIQTLTVSYNYGFSADIGGGPYDRRARITEIMPGMIIELPVGKDKTYATLIEALNAWANPNDFNSVAAVIRIYDSSTYKISSNITLPNKGWLVIEAENGERPTLLLGDVPPTITIQGPVDPNAQPKPDDTATLILSGLMIEGGLVMNGKLSLVITDCTLVPGQALKEDGFPKNPDQPSLEVTGSDITDLSVAISRTIVGALQMPSDCKSLEIRDSIVDASTPNGKDEPIRAAIAAKTNGTSAGPLTTLERVTVFGKIFVKEITLASEVIFVQEAKVERRQKGCIRFSYVPEGSQTPRRYLCEPDRAIAERQRELDPLKLTTAEREKITQRLRPQFTGTHYGQPAYSQLATSCAEEIKTGAEDGSEMGAFSMLQQPQREANLRVALEEYLRFGLEAGIFFVT